MFLQTHISYLERRSSIKIDRLRIFPFKFHVATACLAQVGSRFILVGN